jgi:hypothetical protein
MFDGRRLGPFSLEKLLRHPLSGETLVWRPGLSGWTRVDGLPELATLLARLPRPGPSTPTPSAWPTVAKSKLAESPPSDSNTSGILRLLVGGLVVGLALVALRFAGCWPQGMPIPIFDTNPKASVAEEVAGAQGLPVTAADLKREYGANEIAADRKY